MPENFPLACKHFPTCRAWLDAVVAKGQQLPDPILVVQDHSC